MRMTSAIYLAVLRKDLPSPLAKESDEEKPAEEEEKKDVKAPESAKPEDGYLCPSHSLDSPSRPDLYFLAVTGRVNRHDETDLFD